MIGLERQYWQAIKDRDLDTALELTDDPCILAGAHGVEQIDKKSFIKVMEGADYSLNNFELKEAKVRLLNNDVAIIAYNVHEDLTVDGKEISVDASEASTWIRRNGSWVCALHAESLTGDPYGRDRMSQVENART